MVCDRAIDNQTVTVTRAVRWGFGNRSQIAVMSEGKWESMDCFFRKSGCDWCGRWSPGELGLFLKWEILEHGCMLTVIIPGAEKDGRKRGRRRQQSRVLRKPRRRDLEGGKAKKTCVEVGRFMNLRMGRSWVFTQAARSSGD